MSIAAPDIVTGVVLSETKHVYKTRTYRTIYWAIGSVAWIQTGTQDVELQVQLLPVRIDRGRVYPRKATSQSVGDYFFRRSLVVLTDYRYTAIPTHGV